MEQSFAERRLTSGCGMLLFLKRSKKTKQCKGVAFLAFCNSIKAVSQNVSTVEIFVSLSNVA